MAMISSPYANMKNAGGAYPFGQQANSFIPSWQSTKIEAPDKFYTGPTNRLSARVASPVTQPATTTETAATTQPAVPTIESMTTKIGGGSYYPWELGGGGGASPSPTSAATAMNVDRIAGNNLDYNLMAVTGPNWEQWIPRGGAADYTYGDLFWNAMNYRYGLVDTP